MVACFAYDERALIERYVAGTELAVSVVDTGEGPRALPRLRSSPTGSMTSMHGTTRAARSTSFRLGWMRRSSRR